MNRPLPAPSLTDTLLVLLCVCGVLALAWVYPGIPALGLVLVCVIVFGIRYSLQLDKIANRNQARSLRPLWDRPSTRNAWLNTFPDAPETEIHTFLDSFTDAFDFPRERRFSLSPDDRVVDLYGMWYPPDGHMTDLLELDVFRLNLKRNFGFDIFSIWNSHPTLGDLFARVRQYKGTRQRA